MSEAKWEAFSAKVEAAFEGIDATFDVKELEITWNAFSAGDSVENTVAKIEDRAAQMVVEYFDDSMDGDHESALASCGWGTDEDYGCYDGGLEDY